MDKNVMFQKTSPKAFRGRIINKIQQILHLIFVQSIMCLCYYDNASINLITS